ncbi:MAG TPA: hypothetical protein DCX89_06700, partial [Saprospirales bacterium]|nr:hypothetical protein [Saprospirales bacterium]
IYRKIPAKSRQETISLIEGLNKKSILIFFHWYNFEWLVIVHSRINCFGTMNPSNDLSLTLYVNVLKRWCLTKFNRIEFCNFCRTLVIIKQIT